MALRTESSFTARPRGVRRCALPDGSIRSAFGTKRRFAENVSTPFVGPARLAEAFAVLPDVRRALPEVRFPFERPRVAVAVVAGVAVAGAARRSGLGFAAREAVAALASLAPAAIALKGGELASYHGAEHISIGTYETGEAGDERARPLRRSPRRPAPADERRGERTRGRAPARARPAARALGAVGAVGAAVEIFAWMGRHPRHPVSRALARPGPRAPVARVDGGALCGSARGRGGSARSLPRRRRGRVIVSSRTRDERLDPSVFDLPVEKMREGYYTDAYFNHTRARCSPTAATRGS